MRNALSPILAAAALGVIALASVWMQEPFLVPSLGSAVFAQVLSPRDTSAQPYALTVGQFAGMIGGFTGVFIAQAASVPAFMGQNPLVLTRVLAVVIAVVLAGFLQLVTKSITPAGGATALVVAVGAESASWPGVFHLAVGIVLVTGLGELFRRLLLVRGYDQ